MSKHKGQHPICKACEAIRRHRDNRSKASATEKEEYRKMARDVFAGDRLTECLRLIDEGMDIYQATHLSRFV